MSNYKFKCIVGGAEEQTTHHAICQLTNNLDKQQQLLEGKVVGNWIRWDDMPPLPPQAGRREYTTQLSTQEVADPIEGLDCEFSEEHYQLAYCKDKIKLLHQDIEYQLCP